jgi:hypothetical protein
LHNRWAKKLQLLPEAAKTTGKRHDPDKRAEIDQERAPVDNAGEEAAASSMRSGP